jgi:hypothetical protein
VGLASSAGQKQALTCDRFGSRTGAAILGAGGRFIRRASCRTTAGTTSKDSKMTSTNLLRIALVSASLACGTMAFAQTPASAPAKGTGTRQNHHCKQADGTMDMGKTKKACLADKGTWLKDAPAAAPAPAASAATKK